MTDDTLPPDTRPFHARVLFSLDLARSLFEYGVQEMLAEPRFWCERAQAVDWLEARGSRFLREDEPQERSDAQIEVACFNIAERDREFSADWWRCCAICARAREHCWGKP